jgi:hypothetical protein
MRLIDIGKFHIVLEIDESLARRRAVGLCDDGGRQQIAAPEITAIGYSIDLASVTAGVVPLRDRFSG